MSNAAPGPASGAAGANLFRLPSVRIAVVLDAASMALSVALYAFTSNPLSFVPVVFGGGGLVFALFRARRILREQGSAPTAPRSDQIVQ